MSDDFIPVAFDGLGRGIHSGREVAEAAARAREAQTELRFLTEDVARLFAVTEALWSILKEEHGYDDDRLRAKVSEAQAARRAAAKLGNAARCQSCDRPLTRSQPRCIYCGTEHALDPFAR